MKRNRNYVLRMLTLLILIALATGLLTGCGDKDAAQITSLEQLNEKGRVIGVAADTAEYRVVAETFPKARIEYYSGETSAYPAVAQGKIDAFVFIKPSMENAIYYGLKGVRVLDDVLGEGNVGAVAFSPLTKIPDLEDKVNEFIREVREDGTLDDMKERWVVRHEEKMPEIPVPEKADYHLVVGTSGTNLPFTYYSGTELAGYDIELARRFAAWLGAELEFRIYDYDGIVAAAQTGDVDCVFANLFITPERAEAVRFSEPTYISELGVMVRDTASPAPASANEQTESTEQSTQQSKVAHLSDLPGKRVGVITGSVEAIMMEEQYPDAALYYFDTDVDMLNALRTQKIDAYATGYGVIKFMMKDNPNLTYLDEPLAGGIHEGAVFPKTDKGQALCDEFNAFIHKIKENGVFDQIVNKWLEPDGETGGKPDSVQAADAVTPKKGTIKMAVDTQMVPFVFIEDGKQVGIDMDIAELFCEECGYDLEVVPMNFTSIIPAVDSEKVDFSLSYITYTPERAQNVLFSDFVFEDSSVIGVLKGTGSAVKQGFFESVKESFQKTFIREDRWKLFLKGIGTTLLVTVLSLIFGTLLGFFVFMLCRNGNRVANTITRFLVWLVRGMPVVVLLMILYYIIFGNVPISGAIVSVIGFTLVFGASAFGMIQAGVRAIDTGQLEAAYTLGFTNRKAFYRIILPQAMPHIMPAYKDSITELIKATAIVGYVAVQDLTKMGDIIRSRTYEAFFPLIAVAVIYFILAAILTAVADQIAIRIDPLRRKPQNILKGVNRHD